jgi:hypothetical protein
MSTLASILLADDRRATVAADCARMFEEHVAAQHGLKGIGMKTGLALLQTGRPDAVQETAERLLPEFAEALEPAWQTFKETQTADFGSFLLGRRKNTVDVLLEVVDQHAMQTSRPALKAGYEHVRDSLGGEIEEMLPTLAAILDRYAVLPQ